MATLEEVGIEVSLRIRFDAERNAVITAVARSFFDDGRTARTMTQDITAQLSQARRDGAASLLADVEQRIKTFWSIP